MGHVRFEQDWRFNNCQVLRLESDLLRVDVLPELGGKIYRLVYKPQDRDYLWQNPRIKPTLLPTGTNYDDHFSGGWDELFPNGGPGEHNGEVYPDHGEYWTKPFTWDVDQSDDAITLHLQADGPVTPTRMERWITVMSSSPIVRITYRLTHRGEHPFDFLWSLHPALRVGPEHEYIIPAVSGRIASPGSGRLSPDHGEFFWPHVPGRDGKTFDFSKMPQSTVLPGYEMLYLTNLRDGWYAVYDRAGRCGMALAFDRQLFNTLWLFQSHGGWRGLNVAVVEPCTGYPYDLAQAAKSGRCARLLPGQTIETQVAAVIFTDRDTVNQVDMKGTVS